MKTETKAKIPKSTGMIHRSQDHDTYQLLFLFSYGHWDEQSFAIACNLKDLANRACWVSDVVCGWLVKTYSDEDGEPEEMYEFYSTKQDEGHEVTYFEV